MPGSEAESQSAPGADRGTKVHADGEKVRVAVGLGSSEVQPAQLCDTHNTALVLAWLMTCSFVKY